MFISFIVAASDNNVIGVNNQLPWHLPADMKFFRNTTWGMPVIMGRKTFESLGSKPLPGRTNIIITRQQDWQCPGVAAVQSFEDALFVAKETDSKEVFVIGGGEIFSNYISKADRIYMTRVHTSIDGDIYFPAIDAKKWKVVQSRKMQQDDKHAFNFTFETWEKK